jgi:hypothetical protein
MRSLPSRGVYSQEFHTCARAGAMLEVMRLPLPDRER